MTPITEFVVPATVLGGSATLAEAIPSLMRGEPVFMPSRHEVRAFTPETSVGYPLSRRLIDVPSLRVSEIARAASVEHVLGLPGDLAAVSEHEAAPRRVLGYVDLRRLRAHVNGEARDAQESTLQRFLPGALHDLANALMVGNAAISALEGDIEASRAAYAALRQASAIVNGLRELSHAQRIPKLETLDLSALLHELAAMFRVALGPSLRLDLVAGSARMMVRTDRLLLERTLLNLVLNAREALPKHGRVRVTCEVGAPGFIDVFVDDDGPGVSRAIAGELFAPGVSTKQGFARGFGLSHIAAALRSHDASVTLCDARLGGASFRVRLPVAT